MMHHHFSMLARYNEWANARLLDAAARMSDAQFRNDVGAFFRSMHGTLNHLLVADRIWMHRFTRSGPTYDRLDAAPCETLGELAEERTREDRRILDFVSQQDDGALAAEFSYTPVSTPTPVTQRLAPALTHFFNHQTHHRGQAHVILTAQGLEAPALDLIFFQRSLDTAA